jgi:hypothetical protein
MQYSVTESDPILYFLTESNPLSDPLKPSDSAKVKCSKFKVQSSRLKAKGQMTTLTKEKRLKTFYYSTVHYIEAEGTAILLH